MKGWLTTNTGSLPKSRRGPVKETVIAELLQHATDELRHADVVAARIIQLGNAVDRAEETV